MVLWEEILTQIFGEKQTFQDNGPPISSKFASALTKLWKNESANDQIVKKLTSATLISSNCPNWKVLIFLKIKTFTVFVKESINSAMTSRISI